MKRYRVNLEGMCGATLEVEAETASQAIERAIASGFQPEDVQWDKGQSGAEEVVRNTDANRT